MHLLCLIIAFYRWISTRLWRVGYRQVVLGCWKHFGCPKTQLANFVNFVDFSLARFVHMRASTRSLNRKIIIIVDFSLARFVHMQASAHSLTRKIRLNINFQCLEITIQQSKFYSNISIGALVITLAGYLFITNKQIK